MHQYVTMSPTLKVSQQYYFIPIYQTNITQIDKPKNLETKVYYGICETTFKLRYINHKKSFNHRNRKSDTELSNEHSANITLEI